MPADDDHQDTADEPGLVRAADLIGQLGDPFYPRKLNALFHEFTEIGIARARGYETPADLAEDYPRFFWASVEPYVQDAIGHLDRTQEGKMWLAQLYSHVFVEEHARSATAPSGRTTPALAGTCRPAPTDALTRRLRQPAGPFVWSGGSAGRTVACPGGG